MALPPLAETGDLAAWTGQVIPDADPRAVAVLSAASGLVRSFTGRTWADPDTPGELLEVPDEVRGVVVQAAARVWYNPASLGAHGVDDARRSWGQGGSLGLRLTEADKETLSPYIEGSSTGIGTIGISINGGYSDTIYVPTGPPPSGYPFPWYSAGDLP